MSDRIILKEVEVNNLQKVSLELSHGELIVFTGVSGSGKSSLAFETIYREGQRRYIESLSHHARRYLGDQKKPEAKSIDGIAPTIAIEQKTQGRSPRSTVGTMTGIYDFLRVLFAKVAENYCPVSKERLYPHSREKIIEEIKQFPEGSKLIILAPFAKQKKGEFKEEFKQLLAKGFIRLRIDGNITDIQEELFLDKNLFHDIDIVVDRIVLNKETIPRLVEALTSALDLGEGICSVITADGKREKLYSEYAYSATSQLSYPPLEPHDFSFNHPRGMCEECHGLKISYAFDLDKIIDKDLSIEDGCMKIGGHYHTVRYGNIYRNLARIYGFSVKKPWKKLPQDAKDILLYGTEQKWTKMRFSHPDRKQRWTEYVHWQGILHEAKKRINDAKSESYRKKMQELMSETLCPSCKGSRLKPYPSHAKLQGKTLFEITNLPLIELDQFFQHLELQGSDKTIGQGLVKEIIQRINFLIEVGLYYITLDRSSASLSGGEAQRVRLASEIGSGLVGAIYVLDEPSIGLHAKDHYKLMQTLKKLQDKGNTVIVVEHDKDTMLAADTLVDVGPLAGKMGGEILAVGSLDALEKEPRSITGQYLSGKLSITIPDKRRKLDHQGLIIEGASHHNLDNLNVTIPLKGLVCITGASGSGKSSLIADIVYPKLANQLNHAQLKVAPFKKITLSPTVDKVIAIDQSPIGRTPRSNPATYVKVFDEIRKLFASTQQSKAKGFTNSHFSFNVKEGSCPYCGGMGSIRIEMDFLEDEWKECPQCEGARFEPEVLSVQYKGKSIFDVLEMDVRSALDFFQDIPVIAKKLQCLEDIGLGYISLGQPSTTISGGEAQRVKLAKELSKPPSNHTLYILDEPTTGLHFHDMNKLLSITDRLIEAGNSIIVIEHNMDFIKRADWIIDLGPYGGSEGGKLCGEGTPETIATLDSLTGSSLKETLSPTKHVITKPKKRKTPFASEIVIDGARENNLKDLHLRLFKDQIIFFTGPSGSGKTSLALDTIYREGQRRYIESLSLYARGLVKQSPKPFFDRMEGLSPAIAIEQRMSAVNPRSTVGTLTEIYDLLRIFYAHLGTAYCPETGEEIKRIDKEYVVTKVLQLPEKSKVQILAPITLKASFEDLLEQLKREGFVRIRVNQNYYELDQEIPFDRKRKNQIALVIDRLMIKKGIESRLFEAIDKAAHFGNRQIIVATSEKDIFYNLDFTVESTGKSYPPITPKTFSFNARDGMCDECQGLGSVYGIDIKGKSYLFRKSIQDLITGLGKEYLTRSMLALFKDLFSYLKIDYKKPLKELTPQQLSIFLHGSDKSFTEENITIRWKGFHTFLEQSVKSSYPHIRQTLLPLMEQYPCPECKGSRLNALARNVKIEKISITDFCAFSIKKALQFIDSLTPQIEKNAFLLETYEQIQKYLHFLEDIGLFYLSLDRAVPTLSGGELQRIRLARQLGVGLIHCIYILDEPSVGLHPVECDLLKKAFIRLKELGNTLIVVEHDPDMITIADHIVDFGPKGGKEGGYLTFEGSYPKILKDPHSLTGKYLSGKKKIPIPDKRRKLDFALFITKAKIHNLKNISVDFPIGAWSCITGVSGSGKSSLMHDILVEASTKTTRKKQKKTNILPFAEVRGLNHFDKVIVLDQHPPSLSMRSDVCSYSDTLKHLRTFYASLKEAKGRGLKPFNFSYHHIRGMCKTCFGLGVKKVDLQFLPPVMITCPTCKGYRLNPLTLQVTFKGKHLGQILKMTVDEAKEFLSSVTPIVKKLDILGKVGLGYLNVGQHLSALSGGEMQRLRLAFELSKRAVGKNLYLFDEPTKGLHSEDIANLLPVFHQLVDKGHTLITIEHNLDLIANADYLIDIGPKAAEEGGKVVATGTPEELCEAPTATGKALRNYLQK